MIRPSARFLAALAAALCCAGAAAQDAPPRRPAPVFVTPETPAPGAAPRAVPRPAPRAAPGDSATADTTRPAPPPRPATPTEAALGRLRTALVRGVAPAGPFPALDARFAGVRWTPPAGRAAAVDALVAMRRAGVRAVRTGIVADTLVLGAATRLGIALYQDLPVEGLPAATLLARTDAAVRVLERALARGRPYAAARHYGLTTGSDTSDPRARAYFEALTALAHAAGAETYYETRFPRSDLLSGLVDLVLLDATDADPAVLIAAWRARSPTPAGFAGLGATVVPGRDGGWRTPGSASAQARRLEDALSDLLSLADPPAVTFAARWQDGREVGVRARVSGLRDGLAGADGTPRPAFAVARGFFTGTQRVFAVDAGAEVDDAAPRGRSALLLLGWTLVVGLGALMAGVPRVGTLVPRYFTRHDLYREAVQRGYDLAAGQTAAIGAGLAVAFGIVGSAALRALGRTDALVAAVSSWPVGVQDRLVDLLERPLLLVAVLALAGAVWGMLSVVWLVVVAAPRRLRAGQALSLAVWSRWAYVPLMALALLLSGVGPQTATALAPALIGIVLLAEVVAGYRMMLDLTAVTRIPPPRALLLGFGVPFVLFLAALVALGVAASAEASYVWHLATRG